jgi:phosphoglycerol transferase MdoB-like AlkP superfamily enzyme
LGFDYLFDSTSLNPKLNPWGIDEAEALNVVFKRIKEAPKNQPFYLQFLTNSTHYPYTSPRGKTYKKALLYTDEIIQKLYRFLEAEMLLDQTTIYITGDHGESLGEDHRGNIAHRNYLYEENIRNFLLIIDSSISKDITFSRLGRTVFFHPLKMNMCNFSIKILTQQNGVCVLDHLNLFQISPVPIKNYTI